MARSRREPGDSLNQRSNPGGDTNRQANGKVATTGFPMPSSEFFKALEECKVSTEAIRLNPYYYQPWQRFCQDLEVEATASASDYLPIFESLAKLSPSNPALLIQLMNLQAATGDYLSAMETGGKLHEFSSNDLLFTLSGNVSHTATTSRVGQYLLRTLSLFPNLVGLYARSRLTKMRSTSNVGPQKCFVSSQHQRLARLLRDGAMPHGSGIF